MLTHAIAIAGIYGATHRHVRFHGAFVILIILIIGAIAFSLSRRGRSRGAAARASQQSDENWVQGRGPMAPPPPPPVASPPPPAAAPLVASAPPPVADPLVAPPSSAGSVPVPVPPPAPIPPPVPEPARCIRALATGAQLDGWAVETHGLTKRFGTNTAVDDVELLVPRGCAFGYLGPNGAGKTTLMRTLLGLTAADAGSIALLGIPVPAQRREALARVGAIVDEPRFHSHLSGRQNLDILAAARGNGADRRVTGALGRVGLVHRADEPVASYSMGMRQRLGVAACLLADPELLILDEPMNGLDPAGMHEMRSMIQTLVDEGRTVMLSSHLLDEVERTCDALAIVDRGRVIRQGTIEDLVRGAGTVDVRVDCADPAVAAQLLESAAIGATVSISDGALMVSLPTGTSREVIAEINRRLVEGGVAVYGLMEIKTSLEDWFLSVTSRFGSGS